MNTASTSARTAPDVLVVGGGASGMLAALFAARAGAKTLLLERNEKLGKKLYITGKGRCNVTNAADIDEILRQTPRNPRFLNAALRAFTRDELLALLDAYGTPTALERGGRYFPVSGKASDVTRALSRALADAGAKIELNARALSIRPAENGFIVATQGGEYSARCAVVCTGGVSYPSTGSTGDGYRFAAENGLPVVPPRGALVALESAEGWPRLLQGLSLRNVRLHARVSGKRVYDELGEMLFTHFGFSGPLILEMSSHLPDDPAAAEVSLDLKPGLTPEQLDLRLQRDFAAGPKKRLATALSALLPARMGPVLAQLADMTGDELVGQMTRAQRAALVSAFKALPLRVSAYRPVEEAIVTRGGVDVRAVIPGTLMSRAVPGLFFAGEVLDVDAHTGGFNLQIAFSTGALAGRSAAALALERRNAILQTNGNTL